MKVCRTLYLAFALGGLAAVGVGAFLVTREIVGDDSEVVADAEPTPAGTLEPFWWVAALEQDLARPRIETQTLNGVTIGPPASLFPHIDECDADPDGASPLTGMDAENRSTGSPVEISLAYLPAEVTLESTEAAECDDVIVNVVKRFNVARTPSTVSSSIPDFWGGYFLISRTLTPEMQAPMQGAAERLSGITVAGHPAVLLSPVLPEDHDVGIGDLHLVIADGRTVTVIQGNGMPSSEFLRVAEGLYRQP